VNLTLFQSPWAFVAAAIAAATVAWMVAIDASPGARAGSDVGVLLTTGWVTLALMAGVCLYSLRKFIHRLGLSPEFKLKVPLENLEQAEQRLNEVRRQVLLGTLNTLGAVRAEAQLALERCGVQRVCRADVTEARGPGPRFLVGVKPTEPLGRMARWLHFHVYLGLASGVTLWAHGGLSFASPMGAILNGLSLLVIVTGAVGTVLFALGPRWMTRAERDMNFEDAYVLERSLRKKIREAYGALSPEQVSRFKQAEKTASTALVERTALLQVVETEPESRQELEDIMVLVSQRKRILEDLRGAARVKFWINIWRAVHVPGSFILLGFAVIHTVSVLWY
jgi:hypothetical protein